MIQTPDAAVQFDPATHTYHLHGKRVPGVTAILNRLMDFSGIPKDTLDHKRDLGRAVHEAISLDLDGILDDASVDPRAMPYLHQFRRFRYVRKPKAHYNEHIVHSGKYGFAGQLDFMGELTSLRHDEIALIDWKTCVTVPVTVGPQTAAYEIAARESLGIEPHIYVRRYALKLMVDDFLLIPLAEREDRTVFLSALNMMRWADAKRIKH